MFFFFFFFFSSRRRHTRSDRDWSSDVCSSDLVRLAPGSLGVANQPHGPGKLGQPAQVRSEERRVGKEGRSRWSPYHSKKKNRQTKRRPLTSTFDPPLSNRSYAERTS